MRISCIHQGYELYGSDRCFGESVAAIRNAYPQAEIEVVLPREGPITRLLDGKADKISIEPIWVLRRKSLPKLLTLGLCQLPFAIARAARRLRRADIVYVNTSVIVDYQIASRFFPGKAVLHIHEIPEGPVKAVLRRLARWSGAEVIFNSRATQRAFAPLSEAVSQVIYNGLAAPKLERFPSYDGSRPLRLLMLGRINRIKGQEVLLRAIASLPEASRAKLEVRMVGSAFENPAAESALCGLVAELGLRDRVSVEPFVSDTEPLYRWADVVVAPSRLPESLGRVAIEAMSYGLPALVSSIGGLVEVIEEGRTGWFTPPDDPGALAQRLATILESPEAWRGFGAAARARFETMFSETAAANAIAHLFARKFARLSSGAAAPADGPALAARP